MTEIDVEAVQTVKFFCNSITKSVDGLCFLDARDQELGRAFFREPMKNIHNSPAEIQQYLMVDMFTTDLDF